ncbi:hypothetical protein KYD79_26895, partial [Escherichia coli]|nr:hypothetical protein [Escherichia coli]
MHSSGGEIARCTLFPLAMVLFQLSFPGKVFNLELNDSLCDTGANVNVMSQAVTKKQGILDLQ